MDKEIINEVIYNKVLVAKNNPENGCFADDGEVLIIKPKMKVALKDQVAHHFVGLLSNNRSRYGWVKEVSPFMLDDFIKLNFGIVLNDQEESHLRVLFDSIKKYSEGTVVSATYVQKDITDKSMELKVHKVFFY